jgi:hypothetical protein
LTHESSSLCSFQRSEGNATPRHRLRFVERKTGSRVSSLKAEQYSHAQRLHRLSIVARSLTCLMHAPRSRSVRDDEMLYEPLFIKERAHTIFE